MSKLQPFGKDWKRCTSCGRTGADIGEHVCKFFNAYDHRLDMRRVFNDWKDTGQQQVAREQEQFNV